jgi:general secretion pathway protein K
MTVRTRSECVGGTRRRGGSALIIVLWVIGLMSILVMSFAFDAHLEAKVTSYYRKRTRAQYLAQSGMEIAKWLMAKSGTIDPRADPPADADKWYADARSLAAGSALSRSYPLGDGEVQLEIVTEQARRSVNHLKREEDWEPILDAIGVPEEMWPELIDSFLDWTDADDGARADGAETADHYQTLEPPYRARNGDLYAVEELLLIKGFNRAIVYGGPLNAEEGAGGDDDDPILIDGGGLSTLLTVFGEQKVNINAAPYEVLMTLPDSQSDIDLLVGKILEEREATTNYDGTIEDHYFEDDADIGSRTGMTAEQLQYVTTASSTYFRITARGRVQNVERKVWCTVQRNGSMLTILRWIEDD